MNRLLCVPVLAASVYLISCKDGQKAADHYTLATEGHFPKVGTQHSVTRKMEMMNGTITLELGTEKKKGSLTLSQTRTELFEFVSAGEIKSKITASENSQKAVIDGKEAPEREKMEPLLNLETLLTKVDGKWRAALESGLPNAEQASELKKKGDSFDPHKAETVYGTGSRRVGETWTVDAKDLPFADVEDEVTGNAKLTFKGIEEHEGQECARLEGDLDLRGKISADKGAQNISLSGSIVILRSLDAQTDIRTEFTGKMTMEGEVPNGSMDMAGDMHILETVKIN